ncbi:hypothetical protein KC19_10G096900 [Ceratodon purpureus]|uniref:Uncharacterized protein n=1 Tax=Ceratodon purpureus TaxID=3225 RepID=A0A8T0GL92_CERPU|nr:hypothetical protein KC19_10G096900 [Ceratodon purpureus]
MPTTSDLYPHASSHIPLRSAAQNQMRSANTTTLTMPYTLAHNPPSQRPNPPTLKNQKSLPTHPNTDNHKNNHQTIKIPLRHTNAPHHPDNHLPPPISHPTNLQPTLTKNSKNQTKIKNSTPPKNPPRKRSMPRLHTSTPHSTTLQLKNPLKTSQNKKTRNSPITENLKKSENGTKTRPAPKC